MNVEDLLPRLPDGVGLEIVERKIIEHGAMRVVTSIDLAIGGYPSVRFSSVDDVSAALDLVTALGQPPRTIATAPTPPRPRAVVVEAAPEPSAPAAPVDDEAIDAETRAWINEDDADAIASVEAAAPEEAPLLLTTTHPPIAAPAQSTFAGRGAGAHHSRRADDKQPIVPTSSLIGRI